MWAEIQIQVNEKSYQGQEEPRLLRVHYSREVLGLTGTQVLIRAHIAAVLDVLEFPTPEE